MFTLNLPHPRSSYLVGLVEDDADLVVLSFEGFDGLRELVRDVQFVSVEEQNDPVHPLPEPAQDLRKVIPCRHTGGPSVLLYSNQVQSKTGSMLD